MKIESLYMIMGALLFVIGYLSCMALYNLPGNSLSSESNDCSNLSLTMTADCLNNQVKGFFKYNITNIDKDMNLSELKELGGVCHDYAEYYYDNIPNNFYKKKVTMDLDNETSHMITIISNDNGYCTLDQRTYNCVRLGGNE